MNHVHYISYVQYSTLVSYHNIIEKDTVSFFEWESMWIIGSGTIVRCQTVLWLLSWYFQSCATIDNFNRSEKLKNNTPSNKILRINVLTYSFTSVPYLYISVEFMWLKCWIFMYMCHSSTVSTCIHHIVTRALRTLIMKIRMKSETLFERKPVNHAC